MKQMIKHHTCCRLLLIWASILLITSCQKEANKEAGEETKKTNTALKVSSVLSSSIIYADVIPDLTIATSGHVYNLDLNNDGISDYQLKYSYSSLTRTGCSGNLFYSVIILPFNSNEVAYNLAITNNRPISLDSSVSINSTLNWSGTVQGVLAQKSVFRNGLNGCKAKIGYGGYFVGSTNKYVALRIHLGNNTYYGWVCLSVPPSVNSFTIISYAYNSISNQSILAGQTK